MKIRVLVYDTETTGLPQRYIPAEQDLNNWPYIVQLCAKLIEVDINNPTNYKVIYSYNGLVYPERQGKPITIHPKAEEVHGFSVNQCAAAGDNINTVLLLMQGLISQANVLVCHNVDYDRNVVTSEFLNHGFKPVIRFGTKVICTMKQSAQLMAIPNPKGSGYKWPKLEELYKYLFNENMHDKHQAHNAEGDVDATIKCFLKLIEEDNLLYDTLKNPIKPTK